MDIMASETCYITAYLLLALYGYVQLVAHDLALKS